MQPIDDPENHSNNGTNYAISAVVSRICDIIDRLQRNNNRRYELSLNPIDRNVSPQEIKNAQIQIDKLAVENSQRHQMG